MATEVKPKSNRILLIFGIGLAALAFFASLLLGRTGGGATSIVTGKNVDVVVSTKDILASTQITADMVTIQKFSEDQVPPFAFRAKDQVVGKYAAIRIHSGAAIIDDDITPDQTGVVQPKQAFLPIPKGMVAMQIPTGELVGVGGFIQPDDRIDILVSYQPKGAPNVRTQTAFTSLQVIRVGPAGGANARGISSSLTVIVTLQQAQELKWLLDNTNYKYVLRSVQNYSDPETPTSPTDIDTFSATYRVR